MPRAPARARVHSVSKGTTRKICHGICDITRAKSSGGLCIACQRKVTRPIQSTNNMVRIPAVTFFQRRFLVGAGEMLDGVLMNSTDDSGPD